MPLEGSLSPSPYGAEGEDDDEEIFTGDDLDDDDTFGLVKMTRTVQVRLEADGNKHINQYQIITKVGAGSFGKVKLCVSLHDHQEYAIKIMNKAILKKKRTGRRATALDDVMREVAIMRRLDHPNVVRLFEVIDAEDSEKLYMVMEYVPAGASMSGSVYNAPLHEPLARAYFRDVIRGVEYLHYQHVIHRDIKPENLLVSSSGTVKIGDFGVSCIFPDDDDTLRKSAGSPAFLAPECCSGAGAFGGKAVDVWAMGVTLYVFMFGVLPFLSDSVYKIYHKIVHDELVLPWNVPPALDDLFHGMLHKDPSRRLTIPHIKAHPWVTDDGAEPMEHSEYEDWVAIQAVAPSMHRLSVSLRRATITEPRKSARLSISLRPAGSPSPLTPSTDIISAAATAARAAALANLRGSNHSPSSCNTSPTFGGGEYIMSSKSVGSCSRPMSARAGTSLSSRPNTALHRCPSADDVLCSGDSRLAKTEWTGTSSEASGGKESDTVRRRPSVRQMKLSESMRRLVVKHFDRDLNQPSESPTAAHSRRSTSSSTLSAGALYLQQHATASSSKLHIKSQSSLISIDESREVADSFSVLSMQASVPSPEAATQSFHS